ncbi:MAG TPA: levansucrase, partial [Desulfosporosinus sp.]|nr:levansucrase [Desulfosporosinus sp.]
MQPQTLFAQAVNPVGVQYDAHVQNIGWQDPVSSDGQVAGTVGEALSIEALKVNLVNAPAGASIKYDAHVRNIGWQDPVIDGVVAGTVGKALSVEALKITLENMPGYS